MGPVTLQELVTEAIAAFKARELAAADLNAAQAAYDMLDTQFNTVRAAAFQALETEIRPS